MPSAEFEPTIPAFERAKSIHVLDRAATVIGKVGQKERRIIRDFQLEYQERYRVHSLKSVADEYV
jgi:hypothetical protein